MTQVSPAPNASSRYSDFNVPRIVDETLREGVERCMFPVDVDRLYQLLLKMIAGGLREFVVGSGPENPELYERICAARDSQEIPPDVMPIFLVLLNCWEFTYNNFKKISPDWIAHTTFSFGMISHGSDKRLFEDVVQKFRQLGARHLKVSILNNFGAAIDDCQYGQICAQVDRAYGQGIRNIRINDSVGKLYPESTSILCKRLVHDYPEITFCLHCHNDRGLALANQLTSIYSGFQMVEGSLCGYGNRSGITPIELLVATCLDKHITLGSVPLDLDLLCKAAQAAEVTFLQIPSAFRPVSGQFVKKANFGVLNIPDFLNADGERDYFLNVVNLHPATIRRALNGADFRPEHCKNERFIADVSERLRSTIESRYEQQVSEYEALIAQLLNFYRSAQLTKTDIVRVANEVRCDREPTDNPFMYHESLHAD